MSRRADKAWTMLLAAACMVLTAVVAYELSHPPRLEMPADPPVSDQAPAARVTATPIAAFEMPPLSQYSEMVERPLFTADRRPAEVPETTVQEETGAEEAFRLLGVVVTPQQTAALLQVDEKGKVARLKAGETVNGWQLESVRANGVTLRKGESIKKLPLLRNQKKPRPKKPALAEHEPKDASESQTKSPRVSVK